MTDNNLLRKIAEGFPINVGVVYSRNLPQGGHFLKQSNTLEYIGETIPGIIIDKSCLIKHQEQILRDVKRKGANGVYLLDTIDLVTTVSIKYQLYKIS